MSAPRHLWSGDWQLDSAEAAEELAARRAQNEGVAGTEPDLPPSRPRGSAAPTLAWLRSISRRLARRRLREPRSTGRDAGTRLATLRLRPGRRHRVALGVGLATLLSAGAAYGMVSLLVGSDGQRGRVATRASPWVGIDTASSPLGGVVIADVVPGSPAAAAGLQPGDVVTQIDNQPVSAPSDVSSAIAGMNVGDQVEIQVQRGPMTYMLQATVARRPGGSP
jgi:S1-C subfamily serine protease